MNVRGHQKDVKNIIRILMIYFSRIMLHSFRQPLEAQCESIYKMSKRIIERRLERESAGHSRLLAAVFKSVGTAAIQSLDSAIDEMTFTNGDPIPPIHPHSIFWTMVDIDPARWN